MRVKDMPARDQPRERLLAEGPAALADRELLALLLGSGSKGTNAVELASLLIAHCGDLEEVAHSEAHRLLAVPGIGPAKAARVAAAFDLVRRTFTAPERGKITSSADLANAAAPMLRGIGHERMVAVICDTAGRVIRNTVISTGGADHCPASVREVITKVLTSGGAAFGLAHNHPAGSLEPSRSDLDFTAHLEEAAETVGLRLLDHLVVTTRAWRGIPLKHR
ncbi:DNA repair protein RadC [Thermocatellispora tengchongensis]|uniref:DNA repair protein RadC n=1 Tax=Thermocatellispora tengchongensis TaxID=1073253 RepID=A0A840P3U7_9ACTN|nr:DNA repair protein RadC [Thermocatellispora tengchongensis]MBB5133186.1 DNA repair protein RadC [Thermocatellispora tengchongensis]